jgi:hypothetical protein
MVEVKKLVALGGVGLRGMRLQLLEGFDDGVKAGGARRPNRGQSPCQHSVRGDKEVQTPRTHVCARGPAHAVACHPRPNGSDETRKDPYLACQLSVFRTTDE